MNNLNDNFKIKILSITLFSLLLGTISNRANANIDLNKVALVGGIGGAAVSAATLYLCYKRSKVLKSKLYGGKNSIALVLDQEGREQLKQKLWWYNFGIGASGAALLTSVGAAAVGAYNLYKEEKEKKERLLEYERRRAEEAKREKEKPFWEDKENNIRIDKKENSYDITGPNGCTLTMPKTKMNRIFNCAKNIDPKHRILNYSKFKKDINSIIVDGINHDNVTDDNQRKFLQALVKSLSKNVIDTIDNAESYTTAPMENTSTKKEPLKISELTIQEKDRLALALIYNIVCRNQNKVIETIDSRANKLLGFLRTNIPFTKKVLGNGDSTTFSWPIETDENEE
jgi:hypothetical protein